MVFSSLQAFLDPTPTWHHPQDFGGEMGEMSQLQPPQSGGGGARGTTSMTERARMAKIPHPETALKCPRCESTNTKFCYFNNYSLSQPRHFCKTCRRYWTRGGALRNVPVGGGCRRNKRSKCSNSSKSPSSSHNTHDSGNAILDILGNLNPSPSSLSFLPPPLHHFGDYTDLGMGCGVLLPPPIEATTTTHAAELQYGGGECSNGYHHIPLLSEVNYSIDERAMDASSFAGPVASQYGPKSFLDPILAQMGAVKMEDGQGSRDFFNGGVNQWSDVSGFVSSSAATHIL